MRWNHIRVGNALALITLSSIVLSSQGASQETPLLFGDAQHGKFRYEDFERPEACRQCHVDIFQQWEQGWMSKAYSSAWDEIEYFDLAVEHGKRNPKFKGVADGCNGCHAPVSFMAGDTPPPRPAANSRANEAVSCDVCHTVSDIPQGDPFNFSFHSSPGRTKYGFRGGTNSPAHSLETRDYYRSAKLCGNCHNEKSPWGVYVKGTYSEWLEGPYSKEGVQCQTCHMPKGPGQRAITDKTRHEDMAHHLFWGGHIPAKTNGAIEVEIHPDEREPEIGDTVVITAHLFNQKAGHKIPTGSVEDRILSFHVEARDSKGKTFALPVDRKGFEGEEYTIASKAMAYRDLSEMTDVPEGFDGLPRDGGISEGDRIFRMPYFTETGEMTICQWNTASFGVDYRIGPKENKVETYTWEIPDDIEPGEVTLTGTLSYRLLVPSVAEFLKVPAMYSEPRIINSYSVTITVLD